MLCALLQRNQNPSGTRMRRALAPFSKLESSNHTQSSANSITNTSGFSFRYTQPIASLKVKFEPFPVAFVWWQASQAVWR